MEHKLLVAIWTLLLSLVSCQQQATVETSHGNITGYSVYPSSNVLHFYGIPYAQPPVGDMRWRKPVSAKPWNDTFVAVSKGRLGIACMQKLTRSRRHYNLSEDCLTLNIYTPGVLNNSMSKAAVMFHIHGGGFTKGSAREYEGEHLARKGNVVLVTINYRLSIFGFFDSNGDNSWENLGLWDIKLALEWVRDNIEVFGGDKTRVTIFGGSAGGMTTSLIATSSVFNGLFHRVISQSGTHLCPKLLDRDPQAIQQKVLTTVNCQDLECLMQTDKEKLVKAAAAIGDGFTFPVMYTFAPYVDDKILTANQFELWKFYRDGTEVTDAVRQQVTSTFHQYDFMAGFNSQEGSLIESTLDKLAERKNYTIEDGADDTTSYVFLFNYATGYFPNSNFRRTGFNSLFFEHVNQTKIRLETTPNPEVAQTLMDFYTDLLFGAPTLALLNHHAVAGSKSTYFYVFNYMTEASRSRLPQWFRGARHTEERIFIFGEWPEFFKSSRPELNMTAEEVTLMDEMIAAWSNFAKTGNPNVDKGNVTWEEYSTDHKLYKVLGEGEVDVPTKLQLTRKVEAMGEETRPTTQPTKKTTPAGKQSTTGGASIQGASLILIIALVSIGFGYH